MRVFRTLFFFLLSVQVIGQINYTVEYLQFTDGLPSETVFRTLKKDGFLYVATQRGLSLYDGYVFINSKDITSSVFSLYLKDDKIYGEELGAGIFEINNIYDTKNMVTVVDYFDTSISNNHYQNVYKDDLGNVWSSDHHYLKYHNPLTNHQNSFRIVDHNILLDIIISYLETPEKLIMPTTKGLFVWDKEKDTLMKQSDIHFQAASKVEGKLILFSTDKEVFEYDPNSQEIHSLMKLSGNLPFSIVENVADDETLMLYDAEKLYQFHYANNTLEPIFSSKNKINHVFYDNTTHIFWISTQRGLIKLVQNEGIIQTLHFPDNVYEPVTDMIEDEQSRIWMVKNSKTLFLSDHTGVKQFYLDESKLNRLSISQNRLLLATGTGVYLKDKNDVFKKIISTDIGVKKAVFYDDKYWIIPETGMIKVYDALNFKEIPNYIKNDDEFNKANVFNDFLVSQDDQLWLASWLPKDFGILKFNNSDKKFVEISKINENASKFVADYYNRIVALDNGNLIFSSTGGFNIVNPEGLIVYEMNTRINKIASDFINGIAEDRKGNIWFGCAEGLYQYNIHTNTPLRISRIDGLSSNNILYAVLINEDNKLFISNEETVEIIDPDRILDTQLINELKLTAIRLDDNYLPYLSNELKLKEKDLTQIQLLFSALNFNKKEKLIYRYKFNNEEWHYLGSEPKLTLIKPNNGEHIITIEVGDNLGNWQSKNLKFDLHIIPPIYKTFWFYLFLFCCFFVGAHFFNVYLVREEKLKGELKKRVKDNENRMLRSQMNPHFMFNSLNSINSFIIQNKVSDAEKYLTSFSKLMRNILENSRKETISLRQELETIKLYLDLEAVRMDNKFDYSIQISKNIDTEIIQIPPLIMQPFLENAIWHGINRKEGQG